jgi:hypothetical protein
MLERIDLWIGIGFVMIGASLPIPGSVGTAD